MKIAGLLSWRSVPYCTCSLFRQPPAETSIARRLSEHSREVTPLTLVFQDTFFPSPNFFLLYFFFFPSFTKLFSFIFYLFIYLFIYLLNFHRFSQVVMVLGGSSSSLALLLFPLRHLAYPSCYACLRRAGCWLLRLCLLGLVTY